MQQCYGLKTSRAKALNTVCNPDGKFSRHGTEKEHFLKGCLGFSVLQLPSLLLPFSTSEALNTKKAISVAEKQDLLQDCGTLFKNIFIPAKMAWAI